MGGYVEERAACLFAVFAVFAVSAVFVLFCQLNLVDDGGDWGGLYTFCFLLVNHRPAILHFLHQL